LLSAWCVVIAPSPTRAEEPNGSAALFATTCGWCHSQGGRAPGKGPKLAGTERDDAFIVNRITHGKPGAMPAFGGTLTPEQITSLVGYIRSLPPE